jgi:hypothetical protein
MVGARFGTGCGTFCGAQLMFDMVQVNGLVHDLVHD